MAELNDFLLGLKFKKWTLAYLWITVVISTFFIIIYLFLTLNNVEKLKRDNNSYLFCYITMDLWIALTGILAIEKKQPRLLLLFFWYKIFDVLTLMIILIFYYEPIVKTVVLEFHKYLLMFSGFRDSVIGLKEMSLILIIFLLVVIGFIIYLETVVYRYYLFMKKISTFRSKVIVQLRPTPVCYITLERISISQPLIETA